MKSTMTFAEAAAYQESFDAVEAGTATHSQAVEVDAVINAIGQMMRPIGEKAGRLMDARENMLAFLTKDRHEAVLDAIEGKASTPRLAVHRLPDGNAEIGTPEEVAAAVEDAKAA